MADAHLDHPGEISWFPGQTGRNVTGPCPHRACTHTEARVVAWGPDLRRYTLDQCTRPLEEGGCGGECRAWSSEDPAHPGWGAWMHVGPDPRRPLTSGDKTGHAPQATDTGEAPRRPVVVPLEAVAGFPETVRRVAYDARPTAVDEAAYGAGVEAGLAAVFHELNRRGWIIAAPRVEGQ